MTKYLELPKYLSRELPMYRDPMRQPQKVKRATRRDKQNLPDVPGIYLWSEWRALVSVVMRRGSLYVTPPNGIEIKITPFIAGKFKRQF